MKIVGTILLLEVVAARVVDLYFNEEPRVIDHFHREIGWNFPESDFDASCKLGKLKLSRARVLKSKGSHPVPSTKKDGKRVDARTKVNMKQPPGKKGTKKSKKSLKKEKSHEKLIKNKDGFTKKIIEKTNKSSDRIIKKTKKSAKEKTYPKYISPSPTTATQPSGPKINDQAIIPTSTTDIKNVTHPAFEVLQEDAVNELGINCTLYRHKKSGAELLSVISSDDNKVFGITFRTPPSDSTGIPHILEHAVLEGSRKFRAKYAFSKFDQGSVNTFINAITYPDFTTYVGASRNLKDFYNLVNVFTDGVFYPRAVHDPMIFVQEGWRLELESKDDLLMYNGIVYNEMKGFYSDPDYVLYEEGLRSIFPNNSYFYNSGGDPAVIPDLTFETFVEFYDKFYHPSNARIYFAGDDDIFTRLDVMDSYLRDFDASPESRQNSVIKMQKKFLAPVRKKIYYSANQEGIHKVFMIWLINDKPLTLEEKWVFYVLFQLLLGTESSILFKTLLESGLGTGVVAYPDELLQISLFVGLEGVQEDDVPKVEQLILDTLEKVVKEGFSPDEMSSSINSIMFSVSS
jgi:presequence protease